MFHSEDPASCRAFGEEGHILSKWIVYNKKADFKGIADRFHISQITARILRNRDLQTDRELRMFLCGSLSDLHDPSLLPDLDRAADLLLEKIRERKKIRVIGDYDVDGICSTYILVRSIREMGGEADYELPDRILDGYGINLRIVEDAIEAGACRIGHGTAASGDPDLKKLAARRGTGFEQCPTSNVQTKILTDFSQSPVREFLKAGIPVSIGTDNRTVSRVTLTEEFSKLSRFTDLTPDEAEKIYSCSVSMAFAGDDAKERLYRKGRDFFGRQRQ